MIIAIIGSREKRIDKYIPKDTTLLILGGARVINALAENHADKSGIAKRIYEPDYTKYGKSAPLIRNKLIVENADLVIAIWNGISLGTKYTIDYAKSVGKKVRLILIDVTGTEIFPGNLGQDCPANGEQFDESGTAIECCCDECDFLQCCIDVQLNKCTDCDAEYCPRKYLVNL